MLVENVELTLSHVDLGDLSEFSLMTLFGTAQSHRLTQGLGISIREITDRSDRVLYPGYFQTHLSIPSTQLLNTFHLWENVSIGVEHSRFGSGGILESKYILARSDDEVPDEADEWALPGFPSMTAGTMFTVDEQKRNPQGSVPRSDLIADMPKIRQPPPAIEKFNRVQATGTLCSDDSCDLGPIRPIVYPVVEGRDVTAGHNLMFSMFVRVMDYAERVFLSEHLWPAVPSFVLSCLQTLERETYYLSNCSAGDTIKIDMRGKLQRTLADEPKKGDGVVFGGFLTLYFELYHATENLPLVISRVSKVIAVPSSQPSTLTQVERLLRFHARA